jgi:hypothetical protein
MRVFLLWTVLSTSSFAQTFGTWSLNPGRSTFAGDTPPKSLTIRIEPHPKGEVYTFDRLEANGRTTSVSSILYLDGKSRDFRDFGCSGTQSSRRVDSRTVEILRTCANGEWTLSIRRLSAAPQELVLEITEQQPDGRRFERRLILDKQVLEKE